MSEEFKDFTETPVLTLDPFQEEPQPLQVQQEKPTEAGWNESMLSEDERRMVDQFTKQIDQIGRASCRERV